MTDKSARMVALEGKACWGSGTDGKRNKVCGHDGWYCRGCADAVDEILAALEAGGFELARKHKWFKPDWMDHECCQDCGIVRRADDRHRPCLGPVRVGLRPHMPLQDEYTESLAASNPKEEGSGN